jgi:hypothetical protein
MHQLPNNQHDWALWLHENLDYIQAVGGGRWQGTLATKWDFQEIIQVLNDLPGNLIGVSDSNTRSIEFNPSFANVYQCIDEFFSHPVNHRRVPAVFTIRDLAYTHGKVVDRPVQIDHYLAAVQLCQLLTQVADHVENNGVTLYFLKSHDAKLELKLEYQSKSLAPLPSIELFAAEFVGNTHHQDQKRNIVRSALLDLFKGKRCVSISELLPCFEAFMDNVRSSYAIYTTDFSYEKIRTEVDKQNLEDTLRLNKTVSDIQNQLLALPAALLLAGAGITKDQSLKNFAVWIGICIFAWMMRALVLNQGHSINAIKNEIELRKKKLEDQPADISKRFTGIFNELTKRVKDQVKVLRSIRRAIGLIWFIVTVMVLSVFFPNVETTIYEWLKLTG